MQISRLFQIIYILLERGAITAGELGERFEVSVRTIYRDVDALCQAGIPIYATQGKGGGITLMDHFILNKSVLSEREQNEILIALQSLSAVRYPELDAVLSKLSTLFKKSDTSWIEVDFSSWGSDERQREAFGLLKNAVLHRQVVSFSYFSVAGEKSERRVEPVKLLFKDKAWYLQGYCLQRKAYRTFKIARMADIRITSEPCTQQERREPLPVSAGEDSLRERIDLRLKILPGGAYRVYDDFDEKAIIRHEDGSFTVTASMPGGEWLYGYLLSFGTMLEVLEPRSLRKEIGFRLESMAKKYRR